MRYFVLACMNPFTRDREGRVCLDRRWEWDLQYQAEQVGEVHVFLPEAGEGVIVDPVPCGLDRLIIHSLGRPDWGSRPLRSWLAAASAVRRELDDDDLVQTAGDPLSLSFYIWLTLKGHRDLMFILDGDNGLGARAARSQNRAERAKWNLLDAIVRRMTLFAIRRSRLSFVVGDELFDRYGGAGAERTYACWIAGKDVMSGDQLDLKAEEFAGRTDVRMCYASSLIPSKNPLVLVEIAKLLRDEGTDFTLDVFGEGELRPALERAVAESGLGHRVRLRGHVEYGERFFEQLRDHDVVLVPNLGGEQPRIVFDAAANGCVVIGSRTRAFSIIEDGRTGLLRDPTRPEEFAQAIVELRRGEAFGPIAREARELVLGQTIEAQMRRRFARVHEVYGLPMASAEREGKAHNR